jgi:hypothetical protein
MSQAEQKEPAGIPLRVDWHIPEDVQSRYANNVLVQAGQYELPSLSLRRSYQFFLVSQRKIEGNLKN